MNTLTRREFVKTTLAASAAVAVSPRLRAAAPRSRPNVILITSDDMHGTAQAWEGGAPGNTPNLDSLARQSYGFLNLHGSAPICQPSREALMTGLVPHRNGGVGFNPIRLDVTTLPEVLMKSGYFIAALNKLEHMQPSLRFPWQWKRNRGAGEGFVTSAATSNRNPANYRIDVREAIQAARQAGKPFFLNANINDPHRPFYHTKADLAMGGVDAPELAAEPHFPGFLDDLPEIHEEVRRYYRSIRRADASFGEIWAALEELKALDDTIVLFVADHGMPFPFSKTTLYHGGTHTPCLLRWHGLPAGECDRVHRPSNVDLMPTLLDLLEVEGPPDLDGRSLLPLLKAPDPGRTEVCTHVTSLADGSIYPSRCWRNASLSYIWNPWSDGRVAFHNESMSGQTYPAMAAAAAANPVVRERVRMFLYRSPDELYDLASDPWERRNLALAGDHRSSLAAARARLRDHMVRTADPLLPQFDAFLGRQT